MLVGELAHKTVYEFSIRVQYTSLVYEPAEELA